MPYQQIVLDIETQKGFDEIASRSNLPELGVSLVGLYLVDSDEYRTYEERELKEVEKILQGVTRLIGFNIRRFDIPVLKPHFSFDVSKLPLFDIMDEIEKIVGHRVSLNSVAQATLGAGKLGSGLDAIIYYRNGEMEKLKKYCLEDVRLTYEVYKYGKENKKVSYLSKDGRQKLTIPVEWHDPSPPSNLSLFP